MTPEELAKAKDLIKRVTWDNNDYNHVRSKLLPKAIAEIERLQTELKRISKANHIGTIGPLGEP